MVTSSAANPEQFDSKVLLDALVAYPRGDFSVHLPNHWTGISGKIADTFNAIVDYTGSAVAEFERVAKVVDRERLLAEGFDGYLEKPISYKEFLTSIAVLLAGEQ